MQHFHRPIKCNQQFNKSVAQSASLFSLEMSLFKRGHREILSEKAMIPLEWAVLAGRSFHFTAVVGETRTRVDAVRAGREHGPHGPSALQRLISAQIDGRKKTKQTKKHFWLNWAYFFSLSYRENEQKTFNWHHFFFFVCVV